MIQKRLKNGSFSQIFAFLATFFCHARGKNRGKFSYISGTRQTLKYIVDSEPELTADIYPVRLVITHRGKV